MDATGAKQPEREAVLPEQPAALELLQQLLVAEQLQRALAGRHLRLVVRPVAQPGVDPPHPLQLDVAETEVARPGQLVPPERVPTGHRWRRVLARADHDPPGGPRPPARPHGPAGAVRR